VTSFAALAAPEEITKFKRKERSCGKDSYSENDFTIGSDGGLHFTGGGF
jgi:hypothetical protein